MEIQLIHFESTPLEEDKDHKTLKINVKNLDSILKLVGDRPLCTICIRGPYHHSSQESPFVFGKILECLNYLEMCGENGIDGSYPHKYWNNEFNWEHAAGYCSMDEIWIWNKPFIVSTGGKEVAILLIDSQESFSGGRNSTAILGLSLLMSSTIIFHCEAYRHDTIFKALAPFMEYGKHALNNRKGNQWKPFQNLQLVIQNWNNPNLFNFGKRGGTQFIERILKPYPPENTRKVREMMKGCFEDVNCFLMPPFKVETLVQTCDGNVATNNVIFAEKMLELVSGLMKDITRTKKVTGSEMSGREFGRYLTMFVDVFNRSTNPSPRSLWLTTAAFANNCVMERSLNVFIETFNESQGEQGYANLQSATRNFEAAKRDAMKIFKDSTIYGHNKFPFQILLAKTIDAEFAKIKEKNRKSRFETLNLRAENLFKSLFLENLTLQNDNFYDDFKLTKLGDDAKQQVLSFYGTELLSETRESQEKHLKKFQAKVDQIIAEVKARNKLNRQNAHKVMDALVKNTVETYADLLKICVETLPWDDTDFKDHLEIKRNEALDIFDNEIKPGHDSFHIGFRTKLKQELDFHSKTALEEYSMRITGLETEAGTIIDELVTSYEYSLLGLNEITNFPENMLNDFHTFYERGMQSLLQQFLSKSIFAQAMNDSEKRLKTLLSQKLKMVSEKRIQNIT